MYIEGVEPSIANAQNGSYPVVRPLNMITNGEPTGLAKAFLDWILGDDGQVIVEDEGYIPVN
jgi:phosphate transport system substrate-binding protein